VLHCHVTSDQLNVHFDLNKLHMCGQNCKIQVKTPRTFEEMFPGL